MESTDFSNQRPQENVPNATAVLVLGILSIVMCCCYGIPGLTLGIIAIFLGNKSKKLYEADKDKYVLKSYQNLNAGWICAIVGTVFSSLSTIYFAFAIIKYITDPVYRLQQEMIMDRLMH